MRIGIIEIGHWHAGGYAQGVRQLGELRAAWMEQKGVVSVDRYGAEEWAALA